MEIYDHTDIGKYLTGKRYRTRKTSKGVTYLDIPVSFDIEVSSFYVDAENRQYTYEQTTHLDSKARLLLQKRAIMYVWQFAIYDDVFIGRTWDEYVSFCNTLCDVLRLSDNIRIIVYVHNLSYEFQFLRKRFTWTHTFNIDLRKPLYAVTGGMEYRCSYQLSGYSLSKLSEQLTRHKVAKLTGCLDYSLIRHSDTVLSEQEIMYCVNDVRVVTAYIGEKIEDLGGITQLPLTKTGFVRRYCRKKCLYKKNAKGRTVNNFGYLELMNELVINGMEEFNMLKRAFTGGFTHANAQHVSRILKDVSSYDFTSSYPYVMVSEKFPMSRGVRVKCGDMATFEKYLNQYCCVFDVELNDIVAVLAQDNPISVSRCFIKEHYADNNGRLLSAKRVVLTVTDIDFRIIRVFYKFLSMRVGVMYCYRKEYLPTAFVTSVLDLYEAKTKLKGVQGKETEYLQSKEMLNSCYGMTVTDPLRDEQIYTQQGTWETKVLNDDERKQGLYKYNTKKNRFLFYAWGVFVTAYARRNLFSAIYKLGNDYVYSDTDSVKVLNADAHKAYFDAYNNIVLRKLRDAAKHHNVPFERFEPCNIKGIAKTLGVWDFEGKYDRFKTLGAKRYMSETGGVYSMTVAGVNKKSAVPYLSEKYDDVLEAFTDQLYIPAEATGKNLHTYIDHSVSGEVYDYLGVLHSYHEESGVHLEPIGYSLSLSVNYLKFLQGTSFWID